MGSLSFRSRRVTFRYLGFFSDPSYGPDFEGELFTDLRDARFALQDRVDRGDRYQLPVIHANDGEETRDFMPCVSREARIALYALPTNFFIHYDKDGMPETPNLWLDAIAETYGQLRHELLDFPSHIASIGARGAARIERA